MSDIELMQKVERIAGHIHHRLPSHARIDLQDLVQDGMIGLLDAKRLFDPQKGTKISSFADVRISGAIRDSLRSQDHCSRSVRVRIKQIWAASKRLSQELGRDPTSEETAAALNLPLNVLYDALNMAHLSAPISLSAPLLDLECEGTIADAIADDHCGDAFELVVQREHKKLLRDAFRKLSAKERQAVWLYYLDDNEYTLEEVAQLMGLSAPRISQICSVARKKLSAELRKHKEFASAWNHTNGKVSVKCPRARPRSASSTPPNATLSRPAPLVASN
ncbi:MAG: sigma-70 family RNA polymerase sigma factor [Candidatus Korobacteraceae bacterium]